MHAYRDCGAGFDSWQNPATSSRQFFFMRIWRSNFCLVLLVALSGLDKQRRMRQERPISDGQLFTTCTTGVESDSTDLHRLQIPLKHFRSNNFSNNSMILFPSLSTWLHFLDGLLMFLGTLCLQPKVALIHAVVVVA